MIRNLLFICLTIFSFYSLSQNFSALYGFANVTPSSGVTDPGPSPGVNGLIFGPFFYAGPTTNPNASGRFSFTGWPTGAPNGMDNYANFTGVLSPTVYYEVSIAVSPGFTLDLQTISFAVRRSGTGIRNYCVRSSLDGYNDNLSASTGTNSKLSVIPTNNFFWNFDSVSTSGDQKGSLISLGGQFSALTNSVAFRFYAWNSEANGGSFGIDNVTFTGLAMDTVMIPNPVGIEKPWPENLKTGIYPNPCAGDIINIDDHIPGSKIEIVNVLGSPVFFQIAEMDSEKTKLNIEQLPAGIYFVKVYSDGDSRAEKFIRVR